MDTGWRDWAMAIEEPRYEAERRKVVNSFWAICARMMRPMTDSEIMAMWGSQQAQAMNCQQAQEGQANSVTGGLLGLLAPSALGGASQLPWGL